MATASPASSASERGTTAVPRPRARGWYGVTVVSRRETGTLVADGVVLDEEDRAADGRVYDADAPP
jgi:hypothetical protein